MEEAKAVGTIDTADTEVLSAFQKNRVKIRRFAKSYHAILWSESLTKTVMKLVGAGLHRHKRVPMLAKGDDLVSESVTKCERSVRIQIRGEPSTSFPVGNVELTETQLLENVNEALKAFASLLSGHWREIRSLHLKTTMGKPYKIL